MRKLIRDKIAANILQEDSPQSNSVYQITNDAEHVKLLAAKLDEEVAELKAAKTHEEILEEAADVLEVLTSIVGLSWFKLKDLLRAQHEKHQLCGGFDNRYVLVKDE